MGKRKISSSSKAGIVFPIARVHRYVKKKNPKHRISKVLPVYLAAVMEYLCAEITELAGNVAKFNKKRRITPRHIFLAIANDEELHNMLGKIIIPQGGVVPRLLPQLLPKNKKISQPAIPKQKPATVSQKQKPAASSQKQKPATVSQKQKPATVSQKKKTATVSQKKKTSTASQKQKPATVSQKQKAAKVSPATKAVKKVARQKASKKKSTKNTTPFAASKISDPNISKPGILILQEKKLFHGQKIIIIEGDVLNVTADAIINPTNGNFLMEGQIGQMLQKAGGESFKNELAKLKSTHGPLSPFDAAIMPLSSFPSKFVIHCNGPTTRDSDALLKLEKTLYNCLKVAETSGLKSIAVPLIGTGRGSLAKDLVVKALLKCISKYFTSVVTTSLMQLYFVVFESASAKVALEELSKV